MPKNGRFSIVLFGLAGALIVDATDKQRPEFTLVYDAENLEGDWARKIEGEVPGQIDCSAAALGFWQASSDDAKPAVLPGVRAGLRAMRKMHAIGHGEVGIEDPRLDLSEVGKAICGSSAEFSVVKVPAPKSRQTAEAWTIIEGLTRPTVNVPRRPLTGVARRVALLGPQSIGNMPYQQFGKYFTVDRLEIEALRNLQELMQSYENLESGETPLSIAVFGAPGSGKSFIVKQIARGVLGAKVPILEFNLSQFDGMKDLCDALHVVRDKALLGRTPVVFWDEFDSQEYFWLQYLLAPMQDGEFREGQLVHPTCTWHPQTRIFRMNRKRCRRSSKKTANCSPKRSMRVGRISSCATVGDTGRLETTANEFTTASWISPSSPQRTRKKTGRPFASTSGFFRLGAIRLSRSSPGSNRREHEHDVGGSRATVNRMSASHGRGRRPTHND